VSSKNHTRISAKSTIPGGGPSNDQETQLSTIYASCIRAHGRPRAVTGPAVTSLAGT
jgi:hypothetical protein